MNKNLITRNLFHWSALLSLLLVVSLTACSKKTDELVPVDKTTSPVNASNLATPFDPAAQKLLFQGPFTNGVHTTTGTVKVYEKDNVRTLSFTDFKTDAGPDIYIYVAEDAALTNFINVIRLTQTGNFLVELPANYDPAKQKTVIIWCKAYGVTFGSAVLK